MTCFPPLLFIIDRLFRLPDEDVGARFLFNMGTNFVVCVLECLVIAVDVLPEIPGVTLTEILLMLALLLMPYDNTRCSPQPKQGLRPKKPRKYLQRGKPLAKRGGLPRLAVWMRSIPPTPARIAEANARAADNIEKSRDEAPTVAMIRALKTLNIEYKQENVVFYDGSLYVISDFWLPHRHVACELDGNHHREPSQRRYDLQKDEMVRRQLNAAILRDWNSWFTAPDLVGRLAGRLIEIDRLRRMGAT
jgi:very-short-patch-repair endonuclease